MTIVIKDPDAELDYSIDWALYLEEGEVLTDSLWLISPAGQVVAESAVYHPASSTVVLSGGVVGHLYSVTNRISTSLGRQDDRSFTMRVQEQ